jgi:hypothetical protein
LVAGSNPAWHATFVSLKWLNKLFKERTKWQFIYAFTRFILQNSFYKINLVSALCQTGILRPSLGSGLVFLPGTPVL